MAMWQFLCSVVLVIIVSFNPKVQLIKIFKEQLGVYRNDNTKRVSCFDIITFLVIPILLAILVAMSLPYDELIRTSDTIITVFSLVATLLLAFLALLIDKSTTNHKEQEVVKQTFVTITVDIVYSIFVVMLFAVSYFVELNASFAATFVGVVAFLIIKILLNVFMILKRVFAVLSEDGNDNSKSDS